MNLILANHKINYFAETSTFGKFFSRTPMIAIVAEQTNAAELDRPDPAQDQQQPALDTVHHMKRRKLVLKAKH
jgi:hypothetical protein